MSKEIGPEKVKALRSVMKPLGLDLEGVPDKVLVEAIAADINLHQALIVLIEVLEMAANRLAAFIAEHGPEVYSLADRIEAAGRDSGGDLAESGQVSGGGPPESI